MPTLTRRALDLAHERRLPLDLQYRIFLRYERLNRKKPQAEPANLTAVGELLPRVSAGCSGGRVLLSPILIPELVGFPASSSEREVGSDARLP